MSLKKALKHIKKAEKELDNADASEDAQEILNRMHHQLQGCNLVGRGKIDSDGHFYLGIRRCEYRDKETS